ncbi:MAG: RnfABCDGE type electron transport complex subunit B [Lysobacterales bacterium]
MNAAGLAERIDALLPQTQCTRCGYPTCHAYAGAIAEDRADINQCPPGGADGVAALAQLLGRATKPLNPVHGIEEAPIVVFIDEAVCIGCTKCILACPVDAIVGAAKRMHTIITDECTGCGLCLPPCPVDCIALVPIANKPLARVQVLERAAHARARCDARNERRSREAVGAASAAMISRQPPESITAEAAPAEEMTRDATPPISRAAVLEAIARGKARRRDNAKDPPTR